MNFLNKYFKALAQDFRGATAIEYALIASLVAIAIIGSVSALGGNLGGIFTFLASQF